MPLYLHSFPTRRSSDLVHCPGAQNQPQSPAPQRAQEAFHQQLLHHPHRRSSQRRANRKLPLPCRRLGQQQVRHVGACDQQNQRSEEHTSELQSQFHLVCPSTYTLSLHDALPILFIVQVPKISPRAPPPSAHRKLSTSSCCIIRTGEAPSAERIANSRCRAAALASSKFATLVHAISRTSATIANSAISAGPESRCRTVLPCAPGASTIFLLRNSFSSFPPLRNLRVAACCSSSPG